MEVRSWPLDDLYLDDGSPDQAYSALRERWGAGSYRIQLLDASGAPAGATHVRLLPLDDEEEDDGSAAPGAAPVPRSAVSEAAAMMEAIEARASRETTRVIEMARALQGAPPADSAAAAQIADMRAQLARLEERERLQTAFAAALAERDARIAALESSDDDEDDQEAITLSREGAGVIESLLVGVGERILRSPENMDRLAELGARVLAHVTESREVASRTVPPTGSGTGSE